MNNHITTLSRERLEQLADENTICKVSWDERIEIARALLAVMDAKPFMYAIADNEGKAHFDEICVDADGGLLNDVVDALNIDAEPSDTGYSVVPVYTTPPAPSAPDGWKLVPVEPTIAMTEAAIEEFNESRNMRDTYYALLEHAPAPVSIT